MDVYLETEDFAVSGEKFKLVKKGRSGLLATHPRPKNIDSYYLSENYISHNDAANGLMNRLYRIVKSRALKRKVRLIQSYAKKGASVLDVGAGTGDFVQAARQSGFEASGAEPSRFARERALAKGIYLNSDWKACEMPQQAITLWHVLEHMDELDMELNALLSMLDEDGHLFLALPNYRSWDAEHYGRFWAGYDVPRHLWHFSSDSIRDIFHARNMELLKIEPLWFDAFYVSLLSEKYKGRRMPWLRAFISGLRSNISALRTGEFSSLIYVLKKA